MRFVVEVSAEVWRVGRDSGLVAFLEVVVLAQGRAVELLPDSDCRHLHHGLDQLSRVLGLPGDAAGRLVLKLAVSAPH